MPDIAPSLVRRPAAHPGAHAHAGAAAEPAVATAGTGLHGDAHAGAESGAGAGRAELAVAGTELRDAREAAGLSIEDVSAVTRIRGTLIRDLEAGQIGSCGGAFYARGHIKAVAAVVGLDPEPVLARLGVQAEPMAPVSMDGRQPDRPETDGRRWGSTRPAVPVWLLSAVLVLALTLGALYLIGRPGAAPTDRPSAQPLTGGSTSATAGSGSGASNPEPAVREPAVREPAVREPAATGEGGSGDDRIALRVRATGGASWISVRNTTDTLFAGRLTAGQVRDFQDDGQLQVMVGDAAAVDVACRGEELAPTGDAGAAGRFVCGPDGHTTG